ncbi:MAG: PilZ domain-containing protein [Acidobacteriota bacterium]
MTLPGPEERVPVDLDIRVWGLGADGRAFSQRARAHNISAAGALLCGIERYLNIGDSIGLRTSEKKARCKVVWMMNTRSVEKIKVGVQLVSTLDCPWAALLPSSERDAPAVVPGRRRWERHKITIFIALYDERTPVPIRVTASDFSGSGCYVETLSPFPIGTGLGAEVWIGPEKVTTRALVRTHDPRVGMGIEFVGLKTEEQRRFQAYLHAMDPFGCSIESEDSWSKRS